MSHFYFLFSTPFPFKTRQAISAQLAKHEELSRKVSGIKDSDESDDSDSRDTIQKKLKDLDSESSQEESDQTLPPRHTGLMGMKFMQKAIQSQKLEVRHQVEEMERSLQMEETLGSDEEVDVDSQGRIVRKKDLNLSLPDFPSSTPSSKGRLEFSGQESKVQSKASERGASSQSTKQDLVNSENDEEEGLDLDSFGNLIRKSFNSKTSSDLSQNSNLKIKASHQLIHHDEAPVKRKRLSSPSHLESSNSKDLNRLDPKSISKSGLQIINMDFQSSLSISKSKPSPLSSKVISNPSKSTETFKTLKLQSVPDTPQPTIVPESKNHKKLKNDKNQSVSTIPSPLLASKSIKSLPPPSKKTTALITPIPPISSSTPSDSEEDSDFEQLQMTHDSAKDVVALTQRELMKMAFAHDDVVDEFEIEKSKISEREAPKVLDLTLPGWVSSFSSQPCPHHHTRLTSRIVLL